jgi:hypothetical protein
LGRGKPGGERRDNTREERACNDSFVTKWTTAFDPQGWAALRSLHPWRTTNVSLAKLEVGYGTERSSTCPGWLHSLSSRKLVNVLGDVAFSAVRRMWREHWVRAHRLGTHMAPNTPDFETKAADVIGPLVSVCTATFQNRLIPSHAGRALPIHRNRLFVIAHASPKFGVK